MLCWTSSKMEASDWSKFVCYTYLAATTTLFKRNWKKIQALKSHARSYYPCTISHFSNTVIFERQLTIKNLWMNESHLHCHLFLHTILSFPSLLDITKSLHCKSRMCPQCPQCAGPGPISQHYALSAAPDTSKMGTFPSAPPLAPAKMWIQLLNTGIGISNERQLGGGTIYQGLKHLWRAAEKRKIIFSTVSRSLSRSSTIDMYVICIYTQ